MFSVAGKVKNNEDNLGTSGQTHRCPLNLILPLHWVVHRIPENFVHLVLVQDFATQVQEVRTFCLCDNPSNYYQHTRQMNFFDQKLHKFGVTARCLPLFAAQSVSQKVPIYLKLKCVNFLENVIMVEWISRECLLFTKHDDMM